MISALQLGTLDYATGLRLQRRLIEFRKDNRIGDTLLLLEHPPVITLGRNAKSSNIIASTEELSRRGVEVVECDRGGDVTFHGPGQLVGYPIFDLRGFSSPDGKRKSLGVIEYVRRIEQVLIRTCEDFGISTERICGLTGVWTTNVAQAKVAAIGVHISRSVTSHGFALNVNTDLDYFNLIIPCGITSRSVTSMRKELGASVSMSEVTKSVVRKFGEIFQTEMTLPASLQSLLGEKIGVPMKVPRELEAIHGENDIFMA